MRGIRNRNTSPEIAVRRILTKLGYRYRLNVSTLPGKPDLVFRKRMCVIFVHGCFWHQHEECREGRIPGSRPEYWVPKLKRNVDRDASNINQLTEFGWRVLVIWECQLSDAGIEKKLTQFLEAKPAHRGRAKQ
jgi:DNA mismatch endonuclease (patch repair protein)